MNSIRNYFEEGKVYLGKDIKEVVLNNLDSLACRSIMVNYIKPIKEDHTKISDHNYYTIEINDYNKIYLKRYRDNSLCPEDEIPVMTEELKSIINKTPLLGKEIIDLCNKELVVEDGTSEEFEAFYFNILTNKKFCPNVDTEYFLYCNSSKQFYLKKVIKEEEVTE